MCADGIGHYEEVRDTVLLGVVVEQMAQCVDLVVMSCYGTLMMMCDLVDLVLKVDLVVVVEQMAQCG